MQLTVSTTSANPLLDWEDSTAAFVWSSLEVGVLSQPGWFDAVFGTAMVLASLTAGTFSLQLAYSLLPLLA